MFVCVSVCLAGPRHVISSKLLNSKIDSKTRVLGILRNVVNVAGQGGARARLCFCTRCLASSLITRFPTHLQKSKTDSKSRVHGILKHSGSAAGHKRPKQAPEQQPHNTSSPSAATAATPGQPPDDSAAHQHQPPDSSLGGAVPQLGFHSRIDQPQQQPRWSRPTARPPQQDRPTATGTLARWLHSWSSPAAHSWRSPAAAQLRRSGSIAAVLKPSGIATKGPPL